MKRCWQLLLSTLGIILSLPAYAGWKWNMPEGVTTVSREVFHLHMVIFYICVAIAVVVYGILIYSLIVHRKSRGAVAASFHEHTPLEIIWAIIPFILLCIMAIPATKVLIAMYDASEAQVTIKITGYQWKWQYEYLDQGIKYFSNLSTPLEQIKDRTKKKNKWYLLEVDHELVVPTNQKIRFLMTANDVIHSWWVPQLAIKQDAIPGFVHEAWTKILKPGVYRGQCAELCGVGHAYMPIVVRAVKPEEFKRWVIQKTKAASAAKAGSDQTWSVPKLLTVGKAVYNKYCAVCHGVDGRGQPPVFPGIKGSSVAIGHPISRHINMVLYGVKGTAMQAFGEQLSDAEIAAVVTYERNAWRNNTGDAIQPLDVKKQRLKDGSIQPLAVLKPRDVNEHRERGSNIRPLVVQKHKTKTS